jgi:hypothetical protein
MKSRRRMQSPDGSTNGRKLHCRLEQYRSHQMNDRADPLRDGLRASIGADE